MDDDVIQSAVRRCLDQCAKSDAPLVSMAEFTIRLQDEQKWPEREAREVGRRVFKAFKADRKRPGHWK